MIHKLILLVINKGISVYNLIKFKNLKFKRIGQNVKILNGFNIGYPDELEIENDVLIGLNAYINAQGGILIKRGTITGPNLTIFSSNHKYLNARELPYDSDIVKKKVIIKDNVWIGCNVTILPGVVIGEGCIVAAGAVINKSIPDFSLVGGNPAKVIRHLDSSNYFELKEKNMIHNFLHK